MPRGAKGYDSKEGALLERGCGSRRNAARKEGALLERGCGSRRNATRKEGAAQGCATQWGLGSKWVRLEASCFFGAKRIGVEICSECVLSGKILVERLQKCFLHNYLCGNIAKSFFFAIFAPNG